MTNITQSDIRTAPIYLPPLPEQRRIAAILDQAETLRTQRRTALAVLDSLTQSLFLDMFGDPVANPKQWPKVPLTQTCASPDDIRCGPFGTQLLRSEFKTEGVPLWGIKNVNAKFEIPTHEFVDEQTAKRLSQYSIEPLDIVMTRKGTVGNCAVYPTSFPSGVMHSDLLRLRVSSKVCLSTFLSHQLHHSQDVERQLILISGGAVMPGINVSRLKELLVFLPPLPLQQTFATRIASIEALKATHRRALAALDALVASLQQRAFSGELIPAAPRASAQSLEQLRQLEASIGQEALIFIAKRMPDGDLYNSLKAIYFADRHHLEHYGHQIYNETYCALPHGPVPQSAYDATRVLIGERMFSDFDDDAMRAALRRNDKKLTALRDADFSKLSRSVVESLEWAVRYCSDMKFGQTKTASHDSAYERTPKNETIPLQYIIDTLPPEARQRHWNL